MNNYQFVQSIKIPTNVHVFLDRNKLLFFGPLGINTFSFPSYSSVDNQLNKKLKNFPGGFQLKFETNNTQNEIILQNTENSKQIQTYGNTLISLLNKKLSGVIQGFFVSLEIQGIGYRVILSDVTDSPDSIRKTEQKQKLVFKLGYSHDIEMTLPKNVRAFCPKPNSLCIYGINYHFLSQICATIRNFRKPEIYKGKGIRLKDEKIRLRVGKRK
jgi:large subunit ribosomal protein L6